MTEGKLKAIESRAKAASGPLEYTTKLSRADVAFHIAARTDALDLIAEVRRLQTELKELAEAAKKPLDDMDKYQCWPPGEERAQDHWYPYYWLRTRIELALTQEPRP